MVTGLTDRARLIEQAVRPVVTALANGTPGVNQADVDDLVSEVTENVLRRVRAGAEIRDLGRYAKQAARYAFYGHVRRRRAAALLEPQRGPGERASYDDWLDRIAGVVVSGSPSAQVIGAEDAARHRERITWALGQLSAAELSILMLRHRDGLSGKEIAEILGYKNAAVVDTMAARARSKLADHLSPSLENWALGR